MKVEEILSKHNIEYQNKGKDLLIRCLNPDHEDKHPSMRISPLIGIGHCFSCNFKVDIYKFFGLIKDTNSVRVSQLKDKISNLYKQEVQQYPIGYDLVMKPFRGISVKTLNEFNAFTCEMRGFEGRIWFPICDLYKNIILFQGRYLASDVKPKYIFYPEKIQRPLFPAYPNTSTGQLIITEGIFDLLKLWDNGITNVITGFGLAVAVKYNTSLDYFKILGINTLIPLFDSDLAGERAIKDFEKTYKNNFIIKKYALPDGKDPFDLTTEEIITLKQSLNL